MSQCDAIVANCALVKDLIKLTYEAGEEILKIYHSHDFNVQKKSDASPVTAADMASHHFIINGLKTLTPDIPVISEEDSCSLEVAQHHQCYWLIDPLDGTKEFIDRNGEFTVNLALIEGNKPSFGLVGVPIANTVYWGGKGFGAFKQRLNSAQPAIAIVCVKAQKPMRVLASKRHLNSATEKLINKLGPHHTYTGWQFT